MKLDREALEKLKEKIPSWIPDGAIEKLSAAFPDGMSADMIIGMLQEGLARVKEGMNEDQIVQFVQRSLKEKNKGNDPTNAGNSKRITRAYYDSLLLEMRLMGTEEPDLSTRLLGQKMSSPIMTAALSHLHTFFSDSVSPMEKYAQAAKMTDVLHWVGMTENDEYERIAATGARCVRIVKPYADEDKVYSQLKFAEEHGAVAVGMDIDHTFTNTGSIDIVMGEPMEVKSLEKMKAYAEATSLPFVVKGVLSVRDALLSRDIGAKAVIVSHHGGRIPYAMPPAAMVPEIRKAVGKDLEIIVDCGIESGFDAYKALALGADAVGVGTHVMPLVIRDGAEACAARLEQMSAELKGAMAYTGVENCSSFDPTVIHRI